MSRTSGKSCTREELIRAALQDAVGMMIRRGQTAEEMRARRLENTWNLLLELDPSIDDDMGKAAQAALAVPRIRPTEPSTHGSPYLQILSHIFGGRRGSSEATALAYFLSSLADSTSFTSRVQGCRSECGPASQGMLANAIDHYVLNGIDTELREVVEIPRTRNALPPAPDAAPPPETQDSEN